MTKERTPHHVAGLTGADKQLDPAAEYHRITGRDADDDALPGKVGAGMVYIQGWINGICNARLGDLDVGYRPTLAAEGSAVAPSLPEWVCSAADAWAKYLELPGVPEEKCRQAGIPPLPVLRDILADPPLRLTLSWLALARGLYVASRAVIRGDLAPNLAQLVGEPVRDLVHLCSVGHRSEPSPDCEPGETSLRLVLEFADIARATIAQVRQMAKKRHASPGPSRDFVPRAFHEATLKPRLPEPTDAIHFALLEAVAGIEVITTREQLTQAARKWHNRVKRFTRLGPLPDQPKTPADIADKTPAHTQDPADPDT
jgi:hypothetical protein